MLSIPVGATRLCDGATRRTFLRAGALAVPGLSLSLTDLLRAEERAGSRSRHKAVIHITLGGGPPHQDTFDLKPDAPAEVRGEFKPIRTAVPGVDICEVFPKIAKIADKFAVLRSIVGAEARHDTFQCLTGWKLDELGTLGGRPCLGAAAGKLLGPVPGSAPTVVGLNNIGTWRRAGHGGFLGPAHGPFLPQGPALSDMRLKGTTADHLADRRRLLAAFDTARRDADRSGAMAAMDEFEKRAFEVVTSSRLVEALDLSKEPEKVRQRYGDGKPYGKHILDGSPTANEMFLLARRLVEAGVRVVTVPYGRWDSHLDNFNFMRDHGPKLDQALTALVEDLDSRGMLDDVTVIAWGEFGRTPKINKDAGRDHWPEVNCAILAGGGMKVGQVIGSTTRYAESARDRPIDFQEVLATLYHNLGIDVTTAQLTDPTGRPQFLVDAKPIRELVG
jgi:hypothetical protein